MLAWKNKIFCIIEDDGIGRELSFINKFNEPLLTHQSKGVNLTQSRLELSNALNERNACVEIIDKKAMHTASSGTTVILRFDEY